MKSLTLTDESVQLIISFLLRNKPSPIGSKGIFKWSPADPWGKVRSGDRNESKQRVRNVPLASEDIRGGGRLRDEVKEGLCRRLSMNEYNQMYRNYEMKKTKMGLHHQTRSGRWPVEAENPE